MRILFYATNGLGLGHVTRLLAISRAIRKENSSHEILFLSRCEAGPYPHEDAPFTIRIPGTSRARLSGISPKSYYQTSHPLLWQTVSSFDPHLLVTDTFPEGPEGELAPIMKWPIRKAFVYRDSRPGSFREGEARPRLAPYQMILVAHDPDAIDLPSWLEKDPRVRFTGPISEDGPTEPRENLRKRLGMKEDKAAIVTFGGGGDPETDEVLRVVVRGLRDRHVGVFVATGPLARKMPDAINAREWFPAWPLAPWLPAFDLAVASGGYNTVTELGNAGLPSLLIPFERDLDDQFKRVREAERAGWAISVSSRKESEIEKGLDRLLNDAIPFKGGKNGRPKSCSGAERAAALLLELMENVRSTPLQKVSYPPETPNVLAL